MFSRPALHRDTVPREVSVADRDHPPSTGPQPPFEAASLLEAVEAVGEFSGGSGGVGEAVEDVAERGGEGGTGHGDDGNDEA